MQIIFSPNFVETPYIDYGSHNNVLFDTSFVSLNGLLDLLELKSGLTSSYVSPIEREALFLKVLKAHNNENVFYHKSFLIDDWGVAREILCWRDALILSGWNQNIKGISDKLNVLADIEKDFHSLGVADRWLKIQEFCKTKNPLAKEDSIKVDCPKELIPPVILNILMCLGSQVTFIAENKAPLAENDSDLFTLQNILANNVDNKCLINKNDGSIKHIHFTDKHSAYDWFVSNIQDLKPNSLIINSDNKVLNNVLYANGYPSIDSSMEGANPQTLQLFKLGFSLFERPLNVYNLISYLQTPSHPVPYLLRKELADNIIDNGGYKEEWQNIINSFDFTETKTVVDPVTGKENVVKKDRRTEKLPFLKIVELDIDNNAIPIQEIINFSDALSNWARHNLHIDDISNSDAEIFSSLQYFCSALKLILPPNGTVSYDDLSHWIKNIYRPISINHKSALIGSIPVISDIKCIYDSPEHLIWLDCNGDTSSDSPYSFLSADEVSSLYNKFQISIPKADDIHSAMRICRNNSIIRIKKSLTIVTSSSELNSILEEHPFFTEFNVCNNLKEIDNPEPSQSSVAKPVINFSPAQFYNIPLGELPQRDESYSSIDCLIQRPFDYMMRYIAHTYEYSNDQLADLNTVKGNVAHYVAELLFNSAAELDKGQRMQAICQKFNDEFDDIFNNAIDSKGIVLRMKENLLECSAFQDQLHNSITTLIDIIKQNNYTPVRCEFPLDNISLAEIGGIKGSVDMVLVDQNDNFVIFDFKWSYSISRYTEMLAENKSIQLPLYQKALELKKPVVAYAYYLMPLGRLLTTYDIKGTYSIERENINAYDRIAKSVDFRKKQLANGFVEEAEFSKINDTDYFIKAADCSLIPIELDTSSTKTKAIKALPYVSSSKSDRSYDINDEDRQTTYTILKSRLK